MATEPRADVDVEIEDTVYAEIECQGLEKVDFREMVRDMAAIGRAPNVGQDLDHPGHELDQAYDAVVDAAEAGDYDTALLRFRNALGVQERFDKTASEVTDRHVERQTAKPLLGGHTTRELQAAHLERVVEIENTPDAPQLPRHLRRALARGKGKP